MDIQFTDREIDVMEVLWERGPSLVVEVRGALGEGSAKADALAMGHQHDCLAAGSAGHFLGFHADPAADRRRRPSDTPESRCATTNDRKRTIAIRLADRDCRTILGVPRSRPAVAGGMERCVDDAVAGNPGRQRTTKLAPTSLGARQHAWRPGTYLRGRRSGPCGAVGSAHCRTALAGAVPS